jgi:hypothetical protein
MRQRDVDKVRIGEGHDSPADQQSARSNTRGDTTHETTFHPAARAGCRLARVDDGFNATQPIASISIDAPGDPGQGDNVWSAMDNLIVGSSSPDVVNSNLNTFVAAIAPGHYQNDFHDANGPPTPGSRPSSR